MIGKKIDAISFEDLKHLVEDNVQERKTLEYKSELPKDLPSDKKEFLADVSSFANTDGGDLLYGMKEVDGQLQDDMGVEIQNTDAEIARLENIIRDGISPRISVEIGTVEIEKNKYVLIIRTHHSLQAPHRVTFQGYDKFYRRNTNGKYQMDVEELRYAFIQSSSIVEKIRGFRKYRINAIKASEMPLPLMSSDSFLSIHIIPLSSFSSTFRISSEVLDELRQGKHNSLFYPLYATGWSQRINLDGAVAYSSRFEEKKEKAASYTQLYSDGKIEALRTDIVRQPDPSKPKYVVIGSIEREVLMFVSKQLQLLSQLEFQSPYYIFLSLIGVSGSYIHAQNVFMDDYEPIVQDLLLPEIIIENQSDNLAHKMRPVFDMIWNAGGFSKSLNFDDDNNLKTKG